MAGCTSATPLAAAAVATAFALGSHAFVVGIGQQVGSGVSSRTAANSVSLRGSKVPAASGEAKVNPSVGLAVAAIGAGALTAAKRAGAKRSQVARAAGKVAAPASIAATAIANGNFNTLVAALKKAGLVDVLSGSDSYTVFAPTDAAFTALLAELGVTGAQLLSRPDLKTILLHHVAEGKAMSSSLKDGQKVGTLQGSAVTLKMSGGKVMVGRATVTAADVACSNGVIHVIDKVLLPPAPKFEPYLQVGSTEPLGFFDPLSFAKSGDEQGFRNLRSAELKHGRVAMMAALGASVQHFIKFPGFESVPSGLGAVTTAPGTYGFAALFLVSGALELAIWKQDANKEIGNFGNPLGLGPYDEEMRNRELNNGRMAMFSAMGILVAELVSGKDAIQQFGV